MGGGWPGEGGELISPTNLGAQTPLAFLTIEGKCEKASRKVSDGCLLSHITHSPNSPSSNPHMPPQPPKTIKRPMMIYAYTPGTHNAPVVGSGGANGIQHIYITHACQIIN